MDKINPDKDWNNVINRTSNLRKRFNSRHIKTLGSTQQILHERPHNSILIDSQQSKSKLNTRNSQKAFTLNLSLPLMESRGSKNKLQPYKSRKLKTNDSFIAKLRRKQQARSKLLIQRLQEESKVLSVLQMCQLWKQSAATVLHKEYKAKTIQEIRKKMRNRKQFSYSQNKSKTQESQSHAVSRIN